MKDKQKKEANDLLWNICSIARRIEKKSRYIIDINYYYEIELLSIGIIRFRQYNKRKWNLYQDNLDTLSGEKAKSAIKRLKRIELYLYKILAKQIKIKRGIV